MDSSATVSVKPSKKRGGATGNKAKNTSPNAPETIMALRRRV
ncbi:MAG: hypothetical protein OXT07_03750 [bacterium]|nr:hypothetical protein [bacterium]MDE0216909.1 hypothetical protein [bacterium]